MLLIPKFHAEISSGYKGVALEAQSPDAAGHVTKTRRPEIGAICYR
jgi:hypothetical protein